MELFYYNPYLIWHWGQVNKDIILYLVLNLTFGHSQFYTTLNNNNIYNDLAYSQDYGSGI